MAGSSAAMRTSRVRSAGSRWTGRTTRRIDSAATSSTTHPVPASRGFVFYNTNVLNEYRTADEAAVLQAEYERRYAQYADIAQPFVTTASLRVDIHPSERRVEGRVSYELVNHGIVANASIQVSYAPAFEPRTPTLPRR